MSLSSFIKPERAVLSEDLMMLLLLGLHILHSLVYKGKKKTDELTHPGGSCVQGPGYWKDIINTDLFFFMAGQKRVVQTNNEMVDIQLIQFHN